MPLTHQRTFRVRHYECDAYGHLNNANYLRYMQETAMDASAAVGYDAKRYSEINRHWIIRQTDIEYLHPVGYGGTVEVKTWVVDFHRVRSIRAYEVRALGSDELVARAYTDWVFLDTTNNRPCSILPEMVEAFMPEGLEDARTPRRRFPPLVIPASGVFTERRGVEWRDIDPGQHVNNAVYLTYIEDCGMRVSAAYGWPVERMWTQGFGILTRRHQIEYRRSALMGDTLEVATWVSGVRRSTANRHYTITRVSDGELLAQANSLYVWVDVSTRQPVRIPTQFLTDFAPNIVDGVA